MPQSSTRDRQAGEALFVSQLPLIERVIGFVASRHRLTADAAEEFGSQVKLKFVQDDYAVLRQFQGRSSLQTYLTVVIQRLFLDHRNALWGKWRPSAEARRLGPLAVQLETLMSRDQLTFEEACETLCTRHGAGVSRQELFDISARLPPRVVRRFERDEQLLADVAVEAEAEGLAERERRRDLAARIERTMDNALNACDPQDRLVLRLRFADGFAVSDIARTLRIDQKPLYRRIDRLIADLRQRLEETGLRAEEVQEALAQPGFEVGLAAWVRETGTARPSMTTGVSK